LPGSNGRSPKPYARWKSRPQVKRYGGTWALRECTLAIPAGHVAALVGPNGAGKTTLLNLTVGLAAPSAGAVTVLGGQPAGSRAALDGIAFVAQGTSVYKNLPAADLLHLTRNLNRHFDVGYARARLGELGIPLKRKAGRLSGGQQAQLALTLALGRRPPPGCSCASTTWPRWSPTAPTCLVLPGSSASGTPGGTESRSARRRSARSSRATTPPPSRSDRTRLRHSSTRWATLPSTATSTG
jgi:hypothetical protein